MLAVSSASKGRIRENMSLCLLEPTVTKFTPTLPTVLENSGISENTPMEPVRQVASEKIFCVPAEIQ